MKADDRSCITCKQVKAPSEFSRYKYTTNQGKPSTRFDSRCKSCNRKRRMIRYNDPEKGATDRATSLKWKHENSSHLREYSKARREDPAHRAMKAKAQRLRKARIRSGSDSRDPAIAEIYQAAMDLEKKLNDCVICDDPLELKMHVDHKVPLVLGGQHVAGNLQILSAIENLKKGGKSHSSMVGANV